MPGLSALPFAARARQRSISPVLWTADGEHAFKDEWANICDPDYPLTQTADLVTLPTSRTSLDTSIKASGAASYRISAQDADRDGFNPTTARRSELAHANPPRVPFPTFSRGEERWIAWQVQLGADYPSFPATPAFTFFGPLGFATKWNIITQIKQIGSLGSPIHSLNVLGDQWYTGRTSNDPTDQWPVSLVPLFTALGPAIKGVWVKLMLHTYFDSNPANGMIEFFGDLGDGAGYRQLLAPTYQATQKISDGSDTGGTDTGQTRGCHLRVGIYQDCTIALPSPAVVWFDRLVIATSRAAAETVAFA